MPSPKPNRCSLLLGLALWTAAADGNAEEPPRVRDISSVRAIGMGGAARGFASSGEALLINPAGIAATPRFQTNADALFEPKLGYRVLSVTALDSKLNSAESFPLAGGLGYYNYRSGEGDAARRGSILALGLALPLWPEVLFVGATGRYLKLAGAVQTTATTLDAAAMLKPLPSLGIAAVGYNLVDVHSPEAARSWGFGAALGRDTDYHLDFDIRLDRNASGETVVSYFVGAEYLVSSVMVPRIGYADDRLRAAHEITGGLSVLLGNLALEGSYLFALGGRGREFGVSLRLLDSPF